MKTYQLFLFLRFLCPDNVLNKVKVIILFCGYIVAFKIIFIIKMGSESIFRFVSILFKCDFKCNYFLVSKGVMGMFGGMGKNF